MSHEHQTINTVLIQGMCIQTEMPGKCGFTTVLSADLSNLLRSPFKLKRHRLTLLDQK